MMHGQKNIKLLQHVSPIYTSIMQPYSDSTHRGLV